MQHLDQPAAHVVVGEGDAQEVFEVRAQETIPARPVADRLRPAKVDSRCQRPGVAQELSLSAKEHSRQRDVRAAVAAQDPGEDPGAGGGARHALTVSRVERTDGVTERNEPGDWLGQTVVTSEHVGQSAVTVDARDRRGSLQGFGEQRHGQAPDSACEAGFVSGDPLPRHTDQADNPLAVLGREHGGAELLFGVDRKDDDALPPPRIRPRRRRRERPATVPGQRIDDRLCRSVEAEFVQPLRRLRTPAACVDDEVGADLRLRLTLGSAHDDTTDAAVPVGTQEQTDDLSLLDELDVVKVLREAAYR